MGGASVEVSFFSALVFVCGFNLKPIDVFSLCICCVAVVARVGGVGLQEFDCCRCVLLVVESVLIPAV